MNENETALVAPRADPAVIGGARRRATKTVAAAGSARLWTRAVAVVTWCWSGGVALFALLAAARVVRFERALRDMLPAPVSVERLALETAGKLGLRRVPALRFSEGVETPLLWCVVHPTIVLPVRLTRELDDRQIALVLAHELAHLRRCDHWVRVFELVVGATKFLEGDKITILEVRGTAETFKPGDIYWIKGTYTLASHERATLAAYTTAKNAADGTGKSYTAQTTTVKKGNGKFTLFLPMACEGWPHVSFYPADGGEGFGGNYFGTGESVLKRWWGSKEAEPPAKDDTKQSQTFRRPWRAFGRGI